MEGFQRYIINKKSETVTFENEYHKVDIDFFLVIRCAELLKELDNLK